MTDLPADWIAQGKQAGIASGLIEEVMYAMLERFDGREVSLAERAAILADLAAGSLAVWPEIFDQPYARLKEDFFRHLSATADVIRQQHEHELEARDRRAGFRKV